MASTNKTQNLTLTQYLATDKPSWLTDYNADMATLDAAVSASGLAPARASKSGTHHTVTCTGGYDTIKFTATSDFEPEDTFEFNGSRLPVLTAEGNEYTVPAWKAGDAVVLFLQPESARVLAPMANKADKGISQLLPLQLAEGISNVEGKESYYYLGEDGLVHVFVAIRGDIRHSGLLFSMPEGYKPRYTGGYYGMGVAQAPGGTVSRLAVAMYWSVDEHFRAHNAAGESIDGSETLWASFSYLPAA